MIDPAQAMAVAGEIVSLAERVRTANACALGSYGEMKMRLDGHDFVITVRVADG